MARRTNSCSVDWHWYQATTELLVSPASPPEPASPIPISVPPEPPETTGPDPPAPASSLGAPASEASTPPLPALPPVLPAEPAVALEPAVLLLPASPMVFDGDDESSLLLQADRAAAAPKRAIRESEVFIRCTPTRARARFALPGLLRFDLERCCR